MFPNDRPVCMKFCVCLRHQHQYAGGEIFSYEIIRETKCVLVVTVRTGSTTVASGHRTVLILATNLRIKSIMREKFKYISWYTLPLGRCLILNRLSAQWYLDVTETFYGGYLKVCLYIWVTARRSPRTLTGSHLPAVKSDTSTT
jgi:hypothetical protein